MLPVFILLGREISMYALMSIIGLLSGGAFFCKRIREEGEDDNEAIVFLLVLSLGMMVGGHILFGLTNVRSFYLFRDADSFGDFASAFSHLFGGMIFYGGLIGAFIFGLIYAKIRRLNITLYMDCSAFFAPFFHGFARIGCFFGGCCYGIESKLGFAAVGNTVTDIGEVSRFPVQLLEASLNFLIALAIFSLLKKGRFKGRLFYVYLSIYAIVRFLDEFLRGDDVRGFVLDLSTSQFISIFVELFAIIMLVSTARRRHKTSSRKAL